MTTYSLLILEGQWPLTAYQYPRRVTTLPLCAFFFPFSLSLYRSSFLSISIVYPFSLFLLFLPPASFSLLSLSLFLSLLFISFSFHILSSPLSLSFRFQMQTFKIRDSHSCCLLLTSFIAAPRGGIDVSYSRENVQKDFVPLGYSCTEIYRYSADITEI